MQIKNLSLKRSKDFLIWRDFLNEQGIHNFSQTEIAKLDQTLALFEDDEMLGTGSLAGNILKYIAVKTQDGGSAFNKIVSQLINLAAAKGFFHLFVFTKAKYVLSFQSVGFKKIVANNEAAVLENGSNLIDDYLKTIPKVPNQAKQKIAAIVMNANPFTKGHRYLVERAANENDYLYIFVVSTDVSLFNSHERRKLVEQGTADLKNVIVVDGNEYMVSYATFPAYFLAAGDSVINYQTKLDALIFKERIAPVLNIKTRYLGEEPFSKTTGIYNRVLKQILPPVVAVKILARAETETKIVITATKVRQLIAQDELPLLAAFLPKTTLKFVQEHKLDLQSRIRKGININGN